MCHERCSMLGRKSNGLRFTYDDKKNLCFCRYLLCIVFTGQGWSKLGPAPGVIVFKRSNALVVRLVDIDLHTVSPYFSGKCLPDESVQSRSLTAVVWYGIENRNVRHEAILI